MYIYIAWPVPYSNNNSPQKLQWYTAFLVKHLLSKISPHGCGCNPDRRMKREKKEVDRDGKDSPERRRDKSSTSLRA
jgi:hypothetical protein